LISLEVVFHTRDGGWIAVGYADTHAGPIWSSAVARDSGGELAGACEAKLREFRVPPRCTLMTASIGQTAENECLARRRDWLVFVPCFEQIRLAQCRAAQRSLNQNAPRSYFFPPCGQLRRGMLMTDTPGQSRAVYRPSGKVDWLKFLPGLVVAAGAAIFMAWCLFRALNAGVYLIFVAPFIAALAVAGVWYLVLTWSRCRNIIVAAGSSIALALLLYFGYYHVGLLEMIGLENAHRIDLLPWYLKFRMKTDVARDAGRPNPGNARPQGPDRVQEAFNWLFFSGELVGVLGVLVTAGVHRSSKAFCEGCGKWMKTETLTLPPGSGATLWDSLHQGRYSDVEQRLATTSREHSIGCNLTVEHCPACPAEEASHAVYLTVKDILAPGMRDSIAAKVGSLFKPRPVASLRTVVNHVALSPEEVAVLAASFPGLKKNIEAHPNRFTEALSVVREIGRSREAQALEWAERVATIEAVEPDDAGTVLTRRNAIVQSIIGTVSIFGGIGLAFAPTGVLSILEQKPPDWFFGIALAWAFACLGLNLVWMLFFPNYLTARFMLRQTRSAFAGRTNPAVDLNNLELLFVDIIPRVNWGKMMMENASDIGFLELDRARRELIFEGDRERYWIPVESILEVKHEFWAVSTQHQLQSSPTLNHVVVVRAMTADGPWETWFYRRHNGFRPRTAKRRLADALAVESKIRQLMESVR
jgi:hypothetical protein